ncbi:MAG: beta-ketoacyl synthase N-terminal-like domain-containing protein, partial [Verrucomicrobiota bacterium]
MAVVGLHGRYPQADDLDAYWENLKTGRDCLSTIPEERWDYRDLYHVEKGRTDSMYCVRGGFLQDIDKFDAHFFGITPLEAKTINPEERIMLEEVWSTLEDAGYSRHALRERKVGVFLGANAFGYALKQLNGNTNISMDFTTYNLPNRISYFCDFTGPSMAVDTSCSSSLASVHLACESIRRGECDAAIAGGINLYLHPSKYMVLCRFNLLSSRSSYALFSPDGDGFVPGEGAGAVFIKPLRQAEQDRDHIYGVIKSSGIQHKGRKTDFLLPSPHAQEALVLDVIRRSGIEVESIGCFESQAMGSAVVDSAEWAGVNRAYRGLTEKKGFCSYGSVKPNIGHLETASGIAQLTKVLLQLKHRELVPTRFAPELDQAIEVESSPFYLQKTSSPWKQIGERPRRAAISSAGGGGMLAHMIVEEAECPEAVDREGDRDEVIVISARTEDRLRAYLLKMKKVVERGAVRLADMAFTLQQGRDAFEYRFAAVVKTRAELLGVLSGVLESGALSPDSFGGRASKKRETVDTADPRTAAERWCEGFDIDWSRLNPPGEARRVSLPTYPFERKRHWVEEPASNGHPDNGARETGDLVAAFYNRTSERMKDLLGSEEAHLIFAPLPEKLEGFSWLLLFHEAEKYPEYAEHLATQQKVSKEILYRNVDFSRVQRVMDFGCGFSTDLIALAKAHPHLEGDGFTIASDQAEEGRRRAHR